MLSLALPAVNTRFPWGGASHEAEWCVGALLSLLESLLALSSLTVAEPTVLRLLSRTGEEGPRAPLQIPASGILFVYVKLTI